MLAAGTDTNQRVGGWPWTMSVRADVYDSSLFTESSGHGERGGGVVYSIRSRTIAHERSSESLQR